MKQHSISPRRCRPYVWLILVLSVVGCDLPGQPDPANRPEMPDQIVSFERLYATNCAGCHGANGDFGPAPPLNDPLFVSLVSARDLEQVIRHGRSGTPMPPFLMSSGGALTVRQVDAIVSGIRDNWSQPDASTKSAPHYALTQAGSGQLSTGDPKRGLQVFDRACAGCHGKNGAGDSGEHSKGGAINVPAFLALISDQAVRRIIITGRSDLGMPNFAAPTGRAAGFQPLTAHDVDDLVALVSHWRTQGSATTADNKTPQMRRNGK